jgi:hypothetical protein
MLLRKVYVSVMLTALWASTLSCAPRVEARSLNNEVLLTVNLVQMGRSSNERATAGQLLCAITHGDMATQVNDESLRSIIALLDMKDDSVRYWVALCLGNFGHRAMPAAPKLLKILEEVDCVRADLPPGDAIRSVLKRIGVEAPPRRCE